jgi:hypothetical protein
VTITLTLPSAGLDISVARCTESIRQLSRGKAEGERREGEREGDIDLSFIDFVALYATYTKVCSPLSCFRFLSPSLLPPRSPSPSFLPTRTSLYLHAPLVTQELSGAEELQAAFDVLDTGNAGYIDSEQLVRAVTALGLAASSEEV